MEEGAKFPASYVIHEDLKGSELEKIAAESLVIDEVREFVEDHYKGTYPYLY